VWRLRRAIKYTVAGEGQEDLLLDVWQQRVAREVLPLFVEPPDDSHSGDDIAG
jgi:hypothetical protein